MKRKSRSVVAIVLLMAIVIGMIPPIQVSAATDTSALGEIIDSYSSNSSTFTLNESSRFFVVADSEPNGDLLQTVQLAQRLYAADGRPTSSVMDIAWGPESQISDGDIVIRLDSASGIAAEGYKLTVTSYAQVAASDVDGLLYGLNQLLKHLRSADSNSIQGFTAADAPDTVQRAVSLDCGRKYYTKDWICNFIREMSWMGYNTLELHFSDDSGFRMDFWDPAFYTDGYQPVNDFSWVCGSNYTSWTLSAYQADPDKGKYLTTAEVIEILQTAKEYHIDVIPAFDSPSHLDYMTWKFEQNYYNNPGYSFKSTYNNKTYRAADVDGCINYTNSSGWDTDLKWPYYSAVNVKGEQAKAFVFELYIDIANFFKTYAGSTDFSVGADEVQLSTANLASGYSYAWGYSDFVNYINELNTLLNDMGYTMRMFNDFIGSTSYNASSYDYADNIEILYWDSPFDPTYGGSGTTTEPASYYVDAGMVLYNCIQTNTYYALRKTSSGSDARSTSNRQWTFYHADEESIYNEWDSSNFSEHGDYSESVPAITGSSLGGAYFLIWCDYACINTETEIWNDVYDSSTGETYSLRKRMWSNIIKMWNWDVDDTVTFSAFESVRDSLGDFPELSSSAQKPSDYADECTAYASYCKVDITSKTAVMSLPCTAEVDALSAVVDTLYTGEPCTAIGLYKNTEGELWYEVITADGTMGYVRATDTTFVEALTGDITITDADVPSGHVKGNYFNVTGTITSKYNTLTSAAVYIHSGFGTSGTKETGYSDTVSNNTYTLNSSTIDYNTEFNTVPTGKHTYVISADYKSYYANGDTVATTTGTAYLVEQCFYVLSSSVSQSSCSHSYSTTVLHEATCTAVGTKVYSCATCGYVYEEPIAMLGHSYTAAVTKDPTCTTEGTKLYTCASCGDTYEEPILNGGHNYIAETVPATCQEYELVRYTCEYCADSYAEYADTVMSDWQTTKPEGVDESLIETKTVYRTSDYETTTSYETSLDGYTQVASSWVSSGTGSVQYVNSWPSGFSTSSSMYTKYNNKSSKVTASETDTTKTSINSDKVTGYLWYHWCYSNSYFSKASKTGSYTTFHAYYSDTFTYTDYDSSDGSYACSNTACCTNSDWYWPVDVYTQSYTNYKKLFTYERWTDWSDWSDTAATASATRKVETKTMYRYVSGELGDHDWEDGVCTVCGAACTHTYQNNVCIICGEAKVIQDMYLFGYINGANYACEEDYANLGEYKFDENGQVVVTFSSDSYVAVKAADNEHWYMTDGWQGYVSSATLYNTTTLSAADKLYVPGGTEVTFTLVDNGDDTYTLSYTAVVCGHEKHSTEGICTLCGATVEHSYDTTGYCSCGLECEHDMQDGYCTKCGAECEHVYENFVCTLCGAEKPAVDYYLFGWINGANYACEEDYENLGEYKFDEDGSLVVTFASDSYVAVRASDMENWYMTDGWQDYSSAVTLYNTKILGSNADKIYVPGGTEVTFTLVDNGDDTLTISYVAVACPHVSHSQAGKCLTCGADVTHSYSAETGLCSCGLACEHSFTDGICTKCGYACTHSYQNNVCTACGLSKPVLDYYLVGNINGADYGCNDDYENLGEYKFVDGTLVVYFTQDSYVFVKGSDNESWYMTQEYSEDTSVTLCKTTTGASEKLLVPGGMKITFTLVDNGDDTYVLSYVAVECPHESHDINGTCDLCGETVSHSYNTDGFCVCGAECGHKFLDGVCSVCKKVCTHDWEDGQCQICGMLCDHEWENGVCSVCQMVCGHSWIDGECSVCGVVCGHDWKDGVCQICAKVCSHSYENNVCTICNMAKPVVDYYLAGVINGQDYAWGEDAANLGEYKFEDGQVTLILRQDSTVAVKASGNSGWYMADAADVDKTTAVLYSANASDNGALLNVPGGMRITFTLVDNGNDTLTLSYVTSECPHASHDKEGVCADCGNTVGHSYESTTTDPTCTEDGCTTYTCSVCGDTYSETIAALGHTDGDPVTENEVAATCEDDGSYDTVVYCSVCGEEVSRATTTVPATGHDYDDGVVTTEPTCTEAGVKTYTCKNDASHTYTEPVDALGHTDGEAVTENEVAATCEDDGSYDTVVYCSVCGEEVSRVATTVPATGHDYDDGVVTTEPTCTEAGVKTYTCKNDASHTYTEPVDALGHTDGEAVTENEVAATCTEDGSYDTVVYCSVCGEEVSRVATTVPATGHDYDNGVVTTEPTCTEAGVKTYTCQNDASHTYTEPVDALGHTDGEAVTENEVAATCEDDGSYDTVVYCSVCGEEVSRVATTVPATGHDYDDGVCTECGAEEPVVDDGLFDIAYASMTMGNSLAINFAFDKAELADWTGCYVQITKTYADGRDDVVENVAFADWKSATIGGVAHYYVTFNGIAAKEMSDEIYVTVYAADGTAVSNTKTDSVRDQSMRIIDSVGAEEKTMIVDMLNYGAAAQEYFDYGTDDLANSKLTEAHQSCASEPKACTDGRVSSGNFYASNVNLASNIQLMFAFKDVDPSSMYAVVTFTNHYGTAYTVTIDGDSFEANGSFYVVYAEDLVVADGRVNVTCVMYNDDGTIAGSVTDSLESYTARNSSTELYVKMMQYSDSAYAYFH